MKNYLLAVSAAVILSGCNWVQLTTEGESVSLGNSSQVANCKYIGKTTVTTLDKLAVVERGGGKMQDELLTLARNEAGLMGGNTIMPASLIRDGKQDFTVYSCPP
jgi:hypothetical protein